MSRKSTCVDVITWNNLHMEKCNKLGNLHVEKLERRRHISSWRLVNLKERWAVLSTEWSEEKSGSTRVQQFLLRWESGFLIDAQRIWKDDVLLALPNLLDKYKSENYEKLKAKKRKIERNARFIMKLIMILMIWVQIT